MGSTFNMELSFWEEFLNKPGKKEVYGPQSSIQKQTLWKWSPISAFYLLHINVHSTHTQYEEESIDSATVPWAVSNSYSAIYSISHIR
jgi:hypothetical protein